MPWLRAIATVLIVAGCLLIADAGATVLWQEPLSALYARVQQDRLSEELSRIENERLPATQLQALASMRSQSSRIAFLAREERRQSQSGDAIGQIRMPTLGVDFVIVQGTDQSSLQKGPGLYPSMPYPGLPGTVALAGHRTTFLAPFRDIDKLRARQPVIIDMPYARFTYQVEFQRIVLPSATWVTRRAGYDRLVLTACEPLYSASHRIVVFARLVSTEPRGLALNAQASASTSSAATHAAARTAR